MVTITRISTPTSGMVFHSDKVKLRVGNKIIDTGTLYITTESLAFQPESDIDGIAIGWREISVHGISSDPTKCIYFMLDHKLNWRGVYEEPAANGHNGVDGVVVDDEDEDEGNVSDEEGEDMTECWLIPDDVNIVELIFQSMNECQALHPDDSISEESDFMDNDDYEDEFDPDAHGRMMHLNLN